MRKKALKRKDPHRNRKYKILRENNVINEYTDKKGNVIHLNITKRLLFNEPYKNEEYNREMNRQAKEIFEDKGDSS